MTLSEWLACAVRDVERRNLSELRPLLESLARATESLRKATWNADASGRNDPRPEDHGR
jgi:hypothetical protein